MSPEAVGDQMFALIGSTAFGTAILFGFRHGFDWDHIAALTDLTGSQPKPRKAFRLGSLYAGGHAVMILLLGSMAILFGRLIPASVSTITERLIGVSLLGLAVWMLWIAVRGKGVPPIRSRWMLVIEGVRSLRRRLRRPEAPTVIDHDHPHDHGPSSHGHAHGATPITPVATSPDSLATRVAVQHRHGHKHIAVAPQDPFLDYTGRSSFAVGMLHGIGAETPTQIVLFATAANSTTRFSSIGLLFSFVAGLLLANSVVTGVSTLGFQRMLRFRAVNVGLAVLTASFSAVVGMRLLFP